MVKLSYTEAITMHGPWFIDYFRVFLHALLNISLPWHDDYRIDTRNKYYAYLYLINIPNAQDSCLMVH